MPAGGDDDLTVVVGLLETAGARPAPFPSKLVRALGDAALAPPEVVEPAAVVKPEEPASAAVASYLRAQTRALMAQDPRVRQDLYDSVHKMRVAARRLRSALRTFRPLLDRGRADALEPELRWLGTVLGDPRDREVLHDRLRKELDSLPPELVLGPVAAVFDQEMLGGLRQAQEKARRRAAQRTLPRPRGRAGRLRRRPAGHRTGRAAGGGRAARARREGVAPARPCGPRRPGLAAGRGLARGPQGRQDGPGTPPRRSRSSTAGTPPTWRRRPRPCRRCSGSTRIRWSPATSCDALPRRMTMPGSRWASSTGSSGSGAGRR